MILDKNVADQLASRELYLRNGLSVFGMGFIGLKSEVRSGINGKIEGISTIRDINLSRYSILNPGDYKNVSIGGYGSFAEGVKILGSHAFDRITTSICSVDVPVSAEVFADFKGKKPFVNVQHTVIGHDVWLGSNVQIKNGLVIGHGAIVGAGAVVTKHVPPYAIVAGTPAKVIKMRFDDNVVERLLKNAWYTYDWSNIEIDWGDLYNAMDMMEAHIAAKDVPLIGEGYAYRCRPNNTLELQPAVWTLERQLKGMYDTSDMTEFFNRPNIKEHALKV